MADIKQTGGVPLVGPSQAIKPVSGTKQSPQRKQRSEQHKQNNEDDLDKNNTAGEGNKGIDEYV